MMMMMMISLRKTAYV